MTNQLNPSFDECGCFVAAYHRDKDDADKARYAHEMLLGLDGPESIRWVNELFHQIDELSEVFDINRGQEHLYFLDGEDLDTFMAQHNWSNPVAAHNLGQLIDTAVRDAIASNERARASIRALAS